jgi:ABC-2 type transport system permease protein
MKTPVSFRRLRALCRKETWQILRDPSSNVIAFVLPVVMLFIFGYGINLDPTAVDVGLVLQDKSPEARRFADNLYGSPYFVVHTAETQEEIKQALTDGEVRGFVVVPVDFSEKLKRPTDTAPLQVVADGSEPNTASFVQNYVSGAWNGWMQQRAGERGERLPARVSIESRFWFNPAAESRNFLVPGSISIIMTVVGALLASPVTRTELLLSKVLPYYALGIVSLFLCVGVAVFVMHVPFRGSLLLLWIVGSLFLASSLGLGLLLSTVLRNQFNAAQAALNAAFLPAVMLSGFLFEIRSMPAGMRVVTYLIPARYFVTAMQALFQAGNVWPILLSSAGCLVVAGTLFLGITAIKTRRRLE